MPKKGYKQTEIGLVPNEWEIKKIGDIATVKRGASPRPISDKKWFDESSKIGWIRISDVTNSNKYLNKTEQYLSEDGVKKSRPVFKGELIMSICASIGVPIILNINACIHDGFVVFSQLDQLNVTTEYLYYYISNIQNTFKGKGQTGTQANINTDLVNNTSVPLPPLKEQKRIAEILSTVDEHIDKLDKTIEDYQLLKKGMIKKLLAEGIGHTEFKETEIGRIPKRWQIVKLGERAYIKARIGWRGLTANEYVESGPHLIAGKHIKGSRIIWEESDHISLERYNESPEIQLKINDVIMTKDGTIGRVGYIDNLPEKATINGTMMLIRPESCFYPKYLYYYFQSNRFQKLVNEKVSGSSVPHIFQRDLVNLVVALPHEKEQEFIVNILTMLDERVDVLIQQRDDFKQLKKALMEKLFTGKIRVNQ